MQVKVVILSFDPPRWVRKAASVLFPVLAITASGAVLATPKQWTTGDPLTAADLNALTVLSGNGRALSVGTTHYCGLGPVTTNGNFAYGTPTKTGYAAAKAMCEAACGSTAHMCDGEEILRSKQLGDAVSGGWYAGGIAADVTSFGTTYKLNDCSDWTSADPGSAGPVIGGIVGVTPNVAICNGTAKVMCCD